MTSLDYTYKAIFKDKLRRAFTCFVPIQFFCLNDINLSTFYCLVDINLLVQCTTNGTINTVLKRTQQAFSNYFDVDDEQSIYFFCTCSTFFGGTKNFNFCPSKCTVRCVVMLCPLKPNNLQWFFGSDLSDNQVNGTLNIGLNPSSQLQRVDLRTNNIADFTQRLQYTIGLMYVFKYSPLI